MREAAGVRVGVLALQGAFAEHEQVLRQLGAECIELRKNSDLVKEFDGIILPGGESTVQGKLLRELDMLEELKRKIQGGTPVLATCAGLILLAGKIFTEPKPGPAAREEICAAGHPNSGKEICAAGHPNSREEICAAGRLNSGKEACFTGYPEAREEPYLATLPVAVRRNAYGRQLGSFSASAKIIGIREEERPFPLEFIRAPYIEAILHPSRMEASQCKELILEPHIGPACNVKEVEAIAVIEKLPDGGRGKNIVGVRYQNQIGLAFHPELTGDLRCHEMFLSVCRECL